jgi:hypothetical protein
MQGERLQPSSLFLMQPELDRGGCVLVYPHICACMRTCLNANGVFVFVLVFMFVFARQGIDTSIYTWSE